MRKPEQLAWKCMSSNMGSSWLAQRHEDRYTIGIPDVSFVYKRVCGWIELKAAARGESLLIRPEQVNWMERRTEHGMPCLLVARRGREWAGARVDSKVAALLREPTNFDRLAQIGNSGSTAKEVIDKSLEVSNGT